jgi:hypothetical protein
VLPPAANPLDAALRAAVLDALRTPEIREFVRAIVLEELAVGGGVRSPDELLTTEMVAAEQRCAPKTVRAWIRVGLPARKQGRQWRVRRGDVKVFLAGEVRRERGRSVESILGTLGR